MNKEDFKKAIISLVVHDGLSLVTFQHAAMRTLLGPAATQLSVSLDRDTIRHMLVSEANKLKAELKAELSSKCVFIKADAATRHTKNYMGVNVQFYKDGEAHIKTLAVKDTEGGHDSESIKRIIGTVIQEYDLHVLAIVVDNASAMTKAVRLLNEDIATVDADDEAADDEELDIDNETELNLEMFAGIQDAELRDIHHMRCAIHTLQLAIRDGLKAERVNRILEKVRGIVRKLRTPNLLGVLRRRGGLLPILDMATRWGSTYLMIKRLLQLKELVQDLAAASPELVLGEEDWEKLDALATTLQQPYDVTIRLQSANITPGSFLKEWSALKKFLQKQTTPLAIPIASSMERREEMLFDNDLFLAAILVDARYRILLNVNQLERAKNGLREMVRRVRSRARAHQDGEQEPALPSARESSSSSTDDDFEKELDLLERRRRVSAAATPPADIDEVINAMLAMGRMKVSPFAAAELYPTELKVAALTLSSMPISQVSVERLFSSLKFLLSDQRASMKAALVEALLFLRTNTSSQ